MKPDWIKEISIEELPANYQEMAEIVGIENTIRLARHYGGLPFYFLKIDSMLQKRRDEKIRQEFDGHNYRDLARIYNLSEMHIRRIVHNGKDKRQIDMFGEDDG